MATPKTLTVNGRAYDAATGLPLRAVAKAASEAPAKTRTTIARARPSTDVHAVTQKSKTLRRTAAKRPASKTATHPTRGRSMDIARSPRITKFAPHPVVAPVAPVEKKAVADTPLKKAVPHPVAAKALATHAKKKAVAAKPVATPKQVKEAAIEKALHDTPKKSHKKQRQPLAAWKKRTLIWGGAALAVLGIAYGVYLFVPPVSVSIAASQAGVNATYPEYTPDGFALHQPVTYTEGEVQLTFMSRSNDDSYTITQTKSSWDSTAVLDNIVRPEVGEQYTATKERGLTIYSYKTSAAWVNGGVLYVISSNAHITNEQIRRIATSL